MGIRKTVLTVLIALSTQVANGRAETPPGAPPLAAGDRLEVSVFNQPEYRTEVTVDEYGEIAIPGIGRIMVSGTTAREAESLVSKRLRELNVLAADPTVKILSYRDVAVLGSVEHPGMFAYRPNTTVLQALALAGGIFRSLDKNESLATAISSEQTRLRVLRQDLAAATARRDRLSAQMEGRNFMPATDAPLVEKLEANIAETNAGLRSRNRTLLERQLSAVENQVKTLEQVIAARLEDRDRRAADVARVEKLLESGLTQQERLMNAQQGLATASIDLLDNRAALFTALQDLAKVKMSIAELDDTKTNDLVAELRDVAAKVPVLELEVEGARATLRTLLNREAYMDKEDETLETTEGYRITRLVAGVPTRIDADSSDFLLPGDVLEVIQVPLSDTKPLGQ